MKEKKQLPGRWLYSIAALVIVFGILISALIFKKSGLAMYPTLIADAYSEGQYHLSVPGSRDINLTRTGAYGIYYEYRMVSAAADPRVKVPPAIDCYLASQSTGTKVEAVPDYVETNRYWSKDQDGTGVLIMSITVDEPDTYTFACDFQNGSIEPGITVALGPNYFWEFLRAAWKISLSVFGAMTTFCGSILIGLIIIFVAVIKRQGRKIGIR